ncbi:MAG: hypothetical protein IT221_04340, partial [Fluviicola sp.]|nr:hypothetical protein [Fluviicola sp.]
MRHLAFLIFACFLVFKTHAQLVPNGNSGTSTTAYTNGAANNPIYIWCGTTLGATNGSLTATPTSGVGPFTFEWFYHDQTTSSWFSFLTTAGATSTVNNLASDGYRVEIRNSSNVVVNCFVAWVWNLNTVATATATASGCNATLAGTVNTSGSFSYYNPPPPESIINSTTNIQVCFTATHTWVSDLAFYLVGPAACGSPTILLCPNPGAIGQGSVCNSGDNVTNLCFSRTSTNNLNVCAPAPATLSGTYGTYGPTNTPINWNALNGCNAAAGGWRVQIYDCIGGDVGSLTNATVTFSNLTSVCGSPTTLTYNSGSISSAINDNSCSAASASIFQVPVANNLTTPITLNATTSVLWSSSPATSIAAPTNVNTSASGLPNGTTTYTLTATTTFGSTSCVSSATSSVTVSAPVVNAVANQTHCPGTAVPITTFTSTPAGATFTWTNSNTAIGLGASGSGNLPAFTATNATASAITSNITVTPTLGGCTGTPLTFTISVNPRPTATTPTPISQCGGLVSPPAFVSTPAGSSFTWTNSNTAIGLGASGSGNITPFTGTNATSANITGTITITPTLNGCVGTPTNFTITIFPLPTVTVPANASYCPGVTVPTSTFTTSPTGGSTTWTNSNSSIGLGTSGSGSIPTFSSTNTSSSAISGTITVTPTVNGCIGTASTFTITVNPTPSVNSNPAIVVCNGANVPATTFGSTPSGATYTWTNSNTAIGLGANGTGNQPTFIGTNNTNAPISGNITVTPSLAGCVGTTDVYQITINPTPTMSVPTSISQCGGTVSPSAFVSNPSGATFAWNNTNTSIGLAGSGTGNISSFIGTNAGSIPITGTVSVTPSLNTCVGATVNFNITINPTPVITAISDIVDCENVNIPSTVVSVTPAGANVTWTNSNTGIGLGANGTGNIPAFSSTNTTSGPITGTITVDASANGCNAVAETFDITINQLPTVDPVTAITQCHNTTINSVVFTSPTPGVTFDWTNSNTSIGLAASGTGSLPSFTATNATTTQTSGSITVTPTLGTCIGSPITFAINVNPVPVPTAQNNGPLCPTQNLNLTATGLPGSSYSWVGPNNFTSNSQNPSVTNITVADAGLYTVTVTAAGCTGTASTTLGINPSQAPTITQVGPFCENDSDILLVASIPGGVWSGPGIVNPTTGQFSPAAANLGANLITYDVIAPCAIPATISIVVNGLPNVQFSTPTISGCTPLDVTLTDQSQPSSNSVVWSFGDGSTSSQIGSVNHQYSGNGCFNVTLTSTSIDGCTASLTKPNYICLTAYADAEFTVDNPTHSIVNPIFQMINSSSNATIYSWEFGDGTTSSATNPSHEFPAQPGSFVIMLAANNVGNCPDTAYVTVVIVDELIFHVPNSFTPDGDEYNNMFEPVFYS